MAHVLSSEMQELSGLILDRAHRNKRNRKNHHLELVVNHHFEFETSSLV